MKEKLITKPAAVVLGTALALGLTACDRPFSDPNALSDCSSEWTVNTTSAYVNDMPTAMANLEAGRTKLVTALQQQEQTTDNIIAINAVPGNYRAATELLIGHINDSYYDTTDDILSSPRDEFCTDPDTNLVYESPNYVRAVAALQAAGIEVASH